MDDCSCEIVKKEQETGGLDAEFVRNDIHMKYTNIRNVT